MCVCSLFLSLFLSSPSFSSLSVLVDLMYATSSTPGHVCLAEPTRGGWLVPPSLCLPYLSVWSGPVWSNACRQPCAFIFCFLIFLFSSLWISISSLSHDRHGWTCTLSLPFFISIFTPLPLSVRPPCTTTTPCTFWIQGSQLLPSDFADCSISVCLYLEVDELGKVIFF